MTAKRTSGGVGLANQPPTVELVFPPNFITISTESKVRLRARAVNVDGTIQKVEFFADEESIGVSNQEPYEVEWLAYKGPITSPVLTVRATDNDGATSTSEGRRVAITDPARAPFYLITSPASGARFVAPANIPITARLVHTDGSEFPIDVYLGTNRVGVIAGGPPYSLTITNVMKGDYQLFLRNDGFFQADEPERVLIHVVELGIEQIQIVDSHVSFEILTSFPERKTSAEVSSDLREWTLKSTFVPGMESSRFVDPDPLLGNPRFYRLVIPAE